ncbi:13652_t:CDS:2 [Entrophospora sp. SA101]|nr:13652_t:CDS:2 [Entrophospora sp. SA101]
MSEGLPKVNFEDRRDSKDRLVEAEIDRIGKLDKKVKKLTNTGGNENDKQQQSLNKNYPSGDKCKNTKDKKNYGKKSRGEIIKLDISHRNLKGSLSFEGLGFTNLETLDCSFNNLVDIDISDLPKLTKLNCSHNQLFDTEFLTDLPKERKEKLVFLDISNNKLKQDLTFLESFVNLRNLYIENRGKSWLGKPLLLLEKTDLKNKGNSFSGSLKPLENLKNLKVLNISHADVDNGLEYLPEKDRTQKELEELKKLNNNLMLRNIIELSKTHLEADQQVDILKDFIKKHSGKDALQEALQEINTHYKK